MPDTFTTFGLTIDYRSPTVMESGHRHQEVELNLPESGSMAYWFGRGQVTVEAGRLVVFWGAIPHQLVAVGENTRFHCITLPLALFLQWELPFTTRLLAGELILDQVADDAELDAAIFRRWWREFQQPAPHTARIILLELEARLRRITSTAPAALESPAAQGGKAEAMAHFITSHYTEPLTIEQIASVVHLHPNYAMSLFHKTYRVSLLDYLTQHRLAHAQRLLVTTNKKIIEIALESGFGSHSRFYEAFQQACGQSPGAYRRRLTQPYQPD